MRVRYLLRRACLRSATAITFGVVVPSVGLSGTGGIVCKSLGESERARLVEYVKKKYKFPIAASLTLARESLVDATCFRKLEFKSEDPKRNFHAELFLSPDLRFLTHELLDSNVDPILEERKKQQALAAGLTTGNFPSLGPKDARVSITIFSDFQCPYCARMAQMLRKEILPAEGKTTRLVFRYFPLSNHNWALGAAQATACAQEQGDQYFWQLHDFLFDHQKEFTPENVQLRIAEEAKRFRRFDSARFGSCVAGKKTAARVDSDVAFGNQNGVTGTPTLFINGEHTAPVAATEQLRTLIREAASHAVKDKTLAP
jgi:protein-disulfide isomerase